MKKILTHFFGSLAMVVMGISFFSPIAFAQDAPGWAVKTNFQKQNTTFLPGVPKADVGAAEDEDLFGGDGADTATNLLGTVKNVINWVLGLVAIIALIILIIQGVLMLVNARDSKKIEEGYGTIRNVAIALIFIGVSWLVVSFIFRAIGQFTGS